MVTEDFFHISQSNDQDLQVPEVCLMQTSQGKQKTDIPVQIMNKGVLFAWTMWIMNCWDEFKPIAQNIKPIHQ